MPILFDLINEDYGIEKNSERWARAKQHNSLVIDLEKDLFFWNSMGIMYGTPYVYLTKVRKLSHRSAVEYLKNFTGFSDVFIQKVDNKIEEIVYPGLVDAFHQAIWEDNREYFHSRTITDETIYKYQLGKYVDWYTIPVYNNGILSNIQLRRDNPKAIRYYYKSKPCLFNSEITRIADTVFIVEGLTSCLVMLQNGLPAVAPSHGAESFSLEWGKYFFHTKQIYILFDNDPAGGFGARRTARMLGEYRCKLYNFDEFSLGYDPNDWFKDGGTSQDLVAMVNKESKFAFQLPKPKWGLTN